jgi:sigma-B regulation protein RsbU (phosphoserine phosphatase)
MADLNSSLFRRTTAERYVTAERCPSGPRGVPAGIFLHSRYERCRVDLTVGDVLVMHTDGLTEAQNAMGEESGSQRFLQAVTDVLSLPANTICRPANQKLMDFAGDGAQQDDVTIVAMKVLSSS